MTSRALELLRVNDPNQTWIEINLDAERDDAVIAQALEQNQYVSKVRLRPAQRTANWDHLYRVLAMRGNLLHFVLLDDSSFRAPSDRLRPILQAIQQNAFLHVVDFIHSSTLVAEDLCAFLDAAVHVTDLTLDRCVLTGGAQGARDFAAALQRNTNVRTLKMLDVEHFLDTFVEGLVSNTCVRNLVIRYSPLTEARGNALQGLLESTRSIQRLELGGIRHTEQSFGPIAQGLIGGEC